MSLLFCIIWSSKNLTYKCNTLSVISSHGTIAESVLNDGCFETLCFLVSVLLGFFVVIFCLCFWFILLGWLVLRVFLAPLKPPLQKNSILIIYHLKRILDHVANDDLLRKAQRKPIIENKYKFVSSTWPIPVNPFYQQLNWLWKSLNILENSVEKTSLTLTIGRLSYNFCTSWNPQWSWQQSQFQLPCGICRWEIEVNFGVSLKQR